MDDLSPRKLLALLAEHDGRATVQQLEADTGLSHGKIRGVAEKLREQDAIGIEEDRQERFVLTATGEDALANGLPEKQLLEAVQDQPQSMDELQQSIDAFNIAIGQCKKNGWANIDDRRVTITDEGEQQLQDGFAAEDALETVNQVGGFDDEDVLRQLQDRGLVQREQSTITVLKQKKNADEIDLGEGIERLTPEDIRSGRWKEETIRPFNVEAPVKVKRPGKKHPYRRYLDEVRQRLMAMGFQEAKTDLVEMEFWNFDVLFQAQDHPAREIHDKFELAEPSHGDLEHDEIVEAVRQMHATGGDLDSTGWQYEWDREKASQLMLRSQTTATTIRYLANKDLGSPAKVFAIDRNFRYDEIDQTHFIEFYQAEGIVKAPDLSLKNLFGYLKVFGEEIAGAEKIRFRPGYFPFTEPSVELDAYHPEIGWVEMGGAGLFRPEVRNPLGVDEPVIAWGMGIDRLAMFKLDKDDIRELVFPQDLDYLRKSPAVVL